MENRRDRKRRTKAAPAITAPVVVEGQVQQYSQIVDGYEFTFEAVAGGAPKIISKKKVMQAGPRRFRLCILPDHRKGTVKRYVYRRDGDRPLRFWQSNSVGDVYDPAKESVVEVQDPAIASALATMTGTFEEVFDAPEVQA